MFVIRGKGSATFAGYVVNVSKVARGEREGQGGVVIRCALLQGKMIVKAMSKQSRKMFASLLFDDVVAGKIEDLEIRDGALDISYYMKGMWKSSFETDGEEIRFCVAKKAKAEEAEKLLELSIRKENKSRVLE